MDLYERVAVVRGRENNRRYADIIVGESCMFRITQHVDESDRVFAVRMMQARDFVKFAVYEAENWTPSGA